MAPDDLSTIATAVRDGREYFASNTGHAQFASDVAAVLSDHIGSDRGGFIMDCMPRAWVGSSKANP